MNYVNVKSSQIEAIAHEGRTLGVKFKNGGEYHYFNVSPTQHAALMKSESIGSHFGKFIKSKFEFRRIEKEKA